VIKDHFGRWIKASPYRLFLGAGDSWALKQVHDEILPLMEDGEAKAREEFKKQFPNCSLPFDPKLGEEALYDARNIDQIKKVIAQLQTIVVVMKADPCSNGRATLDVTKDAVSELCKIFAPQKGEIIQTGLHFPLGILKEIFKVYSAQFELWSTDQLSFFSRAVIGSTEAALTTVDGQCCKNGLLEVDMHKGPDRRDGLYCSKPVGIPQDKAPIGDKLGHTMFVDTYNGYACFLSSTPRYFNWYNKVGFLRERSNDRNENGVAGCLRPDWWDTFMESKSKKFWELLCGHAKEVNKLSRPTILNKLPQQNAPQRSQFKRL